MLSLYRTNEQSRSGFWQKEFTRCKVSFHPRRSAKKEGAAFHPSADSADCDDLIQIFLVNLSIPAQNAKTKMVMVMVMVTFSIVGPPVRVKNAWPGGCEGWRMEFLGADNLTVSL